MGGRPAALALGLAALVACAGTLLRGAGPAVAPDGRIGVGALQAHVARLAAPEMEGRLAGTPGERRAARYVAAAMERMGLAPAGDGDGWLEPFGFTAGVALDRGNELVWQAGGGAPPHRLALGRDWRPLGLSRTGAVPPSPVTFAGYGFVAPEQDTLPGHDAFAGLQVRGRWVLILHGVPNGVAPEVRRHWRRFATLRHKALVARERGAVGLLVVPTASARHPDGLLPLRREGFAGAVDLAALSLSEAAANRLLAAAGRSIGALRAALADGQGGRGFELGEGRLSARIALVEERREAHNVLGRLPAAGSRSERAVVIGAHLDHLGRGLEGASLARPEERGLVHPGADDNASGVAVLLEVADRLSGRVRRGELTLRRPVVFAAWSGEELGLLGSEHHTRRLAGPHGDGLPAHVAAYLNLDMVGRLGENLVLQGAGSSPDWPAVIEPARLGLELPVRVEDEAVLPTDATAFVLKGVPVLSAFTGVHDDYHTPRDTPEKLNVPGMAAVGQLVARLAERLAVAEVPPAFAEQALRARPVRGGLPVWLGTIPDYVASGPPGLRLAGVVPDGPAARAGLRAGDVVVSLGGRPVGDVYDYTAVLQALRPGEPVPVEVLRDGARVRLELVPEARD